MVKQVLTALTAVAGIALWAGQPAQAKDWPGGYDPASGLYWEDEFTYSSWNPFGSPPGSWSRPDFFTHGGPEFAPPGSYSNAPNYSYGTYSYAPSYYDGAPVMSYVPSPNYSYGAYAPRRDNMARIRLIVPDGARVWFDDQLTRQTGTMRTFESPALTPNRNYHYDVKVKWLDANGKEMTQTRRIDVNANSNVTVDFSRTGSRG
jgi:uncharacterized protein (TIGR03000 family)